jgi:hypothetical protein
MSRKKEFIFKAIEILSGVAIAYLVYHFSEPKSRTTGLLSIMIGLLGSIFITNILESYRYINRMDKTYIQLANNLERIIENHEENLCLAKLFKYSNVTFSKEKVPVYWMELFWIIRNSLSASSYIKPSEGYDQSYTEIGLEIQKVLIKAKECSIRRVFILDDEDEKQQMNNIMLKHKNAGIKVRYIFRKDINDKSMLKLWARKLESLDFGIVDSAFVSLIILNKEREIKYAKLEFNKEKLAEYKRFYNNLFEEAKEL